MAALKRLSILILFVTLVESEEKQADKHADSFNFLGIESNLATRNLINEPSTGIVNGVVVRHNKYSFMAFIKKNTDHKPICGASIIAPSWILTAAHCVQSRGRVFISNDTAKIGYGSVFTWHAELASIEKVITHPKYDSFHTSNGYDLAVIKLEHPLIFKHGLITSIDLPKQSRIYEGSDDLIVIGWGVQQEAQNIDYSLPYLQPSWLKEVEQVFVSPGKCRHMFEKGEFSIRAKKTHICAIGASSKGDSCQGDSGGPLFHQSNDGRFVQFGIVSTGIGCARAGIPGLYTMVSYFSDWIFQSINDK